MTSGKRKGAVRATGVAVVLLAAVAVARQSDYRLGALKFPARTYPAIRAQGENLEVLYSAGSGAGQFEVTVNAPYLSRTLSVASAVYDVGAGLWKLTVPIPADLPADFYDVTVSSTAGSDTEKGALSVVDAYPRSFYFVHISDTQPYLAGHWAAVANAVKDINIISPAFVILTGDVVEFGTETEWKTILPYFDKLEVPIFFIPGNHDIFWMDCCRRQLYHDRWKAFVGPLSYSFDFGKNRFAGVEISGYEDESLPPLFGCVGDFGMAVTACPYAHVPDDQMSWLDRVLSEAAGYQGRFVFAHQLEQEKPEQTTTLKEIFDRHKVTAFLYGHLHKDGLSQTGTTPTKLIMTTTMHDGKGRLIRVRDGQIVTSTYNGEPAASMPLDGRLSLSYAPANDGTAEAVTARLTNPLMESFEQVKLRFVLKKTVKPFQVEGGVLTQRVDTDQHTLLYVQTTLPAQSEKTVAVKPLDFDSPVVSRPKNPVLLVHGYGGSILGDLSVDIYWAYMEAKLKNDGFDVHKISLSWGALQDVRKSAQEVKDKVVQIRQQTGAAKVDVVGHSEGGLVIRYYAKNLGGHEMSDAVVTIATPNRGTIMSEIGPGEAARQMEVGSAFLRELNAGDTMPGDVTYTSIFSTADELVVPQVNGYFAGAVNEVVNLFGHVGIIANDIVYEWLKGALTSKVAKGVTPVTIGGGEPITASDTVSLTLVGMNTLLPDTFVPKEMMVCEDSFTLSCSWEPYRQTKSYRFAFPSVEGLKEIYVKFRDVLGNESPRYSAQVLLDKTAPIGGVLVDGGRSTTATQDVTLTLPAFDNSEKYGAFNGLNFLTAYGIPGVGVDQMIVSEDEAFSDAVWEPYQKTKAFRLSEGEGTKTVYARFRDRAGNVSAVFSGSIRLSLSGPTLSVTSPAPDFYTRSDQVTVQGKTDPGAAVTVAGQTVAVDAQGSFSSAVSLQEGANLITIEASDSLGRTRREERTVTRDLTPPAIEITSHTSGQVVNTSNLNLTGQAEAGSQVWVNDQPAAVESTGDFGVTVTLAEGENTLTIRALDRAGNETTTTFTVTLDTTPPALAVTSPADKMTTPSDSVVVEGSTEAGATLTVQGEKVTVAADGTFSHTLVLTPGEQAIEVAAEDAAGNQATVTRTVFRQQGPLLTVSSPPGDISVNATLLEVSGQTQTGVQLKVNGALQSVDAQGKFLTSVSLQPGINTVTVEAAGATGTSTITRSVTLDQTPPILSVVEPQDQQPINKLSVTVAGKTEAGGTLTVNDQPVAVGTDGAFLANVPLTAGNLKLTLTARDPAGNLTTVTRQLLLDQEPPQLSVSGVEDGAVYAAAQVTLTGEVSGADALNVNGEPVSFTTTFQASLTLREGENQIIVEAVDKAGNVTAKRYTVYLDTSQAGFGQTELAEVAQNRVKLVWRTSKPTTTQVLYGKTESLGTETAHHTRLTSLHEMVIENLDPGETYYYQLRGVDGAGNEGSSALRDFSTLKPYSQTLGAGVHLFSFPVSPSTPDPAALFGLSPSELDGKLAKWNTVLKRYEVFQQGVAGNPSQDNLLTRIELGEAYWLKLEKEVQLSFEGQPLSRAQIKKQPLARGWNMIGVGLTDPVPWTALQFELDGLVQDFEGAAQAGWIAKYAWGFASEGGFRLIHPQLSEDISLRPGFGYFIYAFKEGLQLHWKHGLQRQAAAKTGRTPATLWRLKASSRRGSDSSLQIGFGEEALLIPKPRPPFVAAPELSIQRHGEAFAVDVRQASEPSPEWEVLLTGLPGEEVAIELVADPGEGALLLTDGDTGVEHDLSSARKVSLRLPADGSKRLLLHSSRSQPKVRLLSLHNYPNPVSRTTNFALTFNQPVAKFSSADPCGSDLQVDIYDARGRAVAALRGGQPSAAGRGCLVRWSGRTDGGQPVANGVYLYRVSYRTKDGTISELGKLVVLR